MLKLQNIFFCLKCFYNIFFYFLRLEEIPGEDAEVFKQYTKEELDGSDVDQYKHELNLLEENLSAKRPDLKAIEEFKRKEAVYLEVRFNFYTNFVLCPDYWVDSNWNSSQLSTWAENFHMYLYDVVIWRFFLVFQRVAELDEITQIRDRARKRHDDLRKTRLNEFMEGFGIITGKLKEMYQVNISSFFLSVSKRKLSASTDHFFSQKFA